MAPPRPEMLALFVLAELPHYRGGVVRELLVQDEIACEFWAAKAVRVSGIPSADAVLLRRTRALRNLRVGPFYWQVGPWLRVLTGEYGAIVFLGDAKVLSTWFLAAIARLRGKSVLYWTIGWHRPEFGPKRLVRLAFYRLAHQLLIYGEGGRDLGIRLGYPSTRMTVVWNSLGVDHVPEIRHDTSITGELRVIYVGRLTPAKGLDVLIEAAARSVLGRRVRLTLVGDGPEKERLVALSRTLDVDCEFEGSVHCPEELARLYSRADLTVIPGAAGLTVVQSLAHGVPVITHDDCFAQMPEYEAITPGLNGDLFKRGDVEDLVVTLEKWIRKSPMEWKDAREACAAEVERRWTPSRQARAIVGGIMSVCKDAPTASTRASRSAQRGGSASE